MREYSDLDVYLSLSPSQLADTVLHCPVCGRDHKIPFKIVRSGKEQLTEIPEILIDLIGQLPEKIGVIYDRQIEEKLERLFFITFEGLNLPYIRIPLGRPGFLLDSTTQLGDETAAGLPDEIDFLIGVGSGVISDLTKWIATKGDLPFLLVGTAGSMNGFTSITATMTENEVKTSRWLNPADAVLLDAQLLASAPEKMTCSGIADLLARNVANADWKLSEKLRGTYFCPVSFRMMEKYQQAYLPLASNLGRNESGALAIFAEGVLVSGYSMTVLDGETSPSSGSEHVISHFFDFQHEVFGLSKNFHGTQVGIGTVMMSTAYEMLRECDPAGFDLDDLERRRLSQTAIVLDHQRVFGDHGRGFDEVAAKKRIPDLEYRPYIKGIIDSWDGLWADLDPYLIPSSEIRAVLEAAGAPTRLADLDRSDEDAVQALLYGSHYRPRYTVLDLFWELGLFPLMAPEILARSGVFN